MRQIESEKKLLKNLLDSHRNLPIKIQKDEASFVKSLIDQAINAIESAKIPSS